MRDHRAGKQAAQGGSGKALTLKARRGRDAIDAQQTTSTGAASGNCRPVAFRAQYFFVISAIAARRRSGPLVAGHVCLAADPPSAEAPDASWRDADHNRLRRRKANLGAGPVLNTRLTGLRSQETYQVSDRSLGNPHSHLVPR